MKKVAVILTSEPQNGGEHQYLMLLMESLLRCNKKYIELLGICDSRFWRKWCRTYKIDFIRYKISLSTKEKILNNKYPNMSMAINIWKNNFAKVILENGVDLLISGQQTIYVPKCPCKVIHPVHDLMHRYESRFPEVKRDYEEREILFKNVARTASVVLVDSSLGKKQFVESYKRSSRFPKVEVLPFVIPTHILNRKEEVVNTPSKYIFYPAQFWKHKNHLNLIKTIGIVKEEEKDIHLILVGSEKNAIKEVKEAICQNDLKENVQILGFVTDEQITYLYKHAVAMIMPSYFGPTNIPPLEAMALGCPTIVSDKYAMGEQVGDAGLLFNPDSPHEMAECILKVWRNDNLRSEMIEKGYQQVEKWTQKDFKNKFIKIVLRELKCV